VRILFVTARQFWPMDTGGKLRDFHLARTLAGRADVTYLGFADADGGPCPADLARPFKQIIMEPLHRGRSPVDLMRGLIGKLPATVLKYTTDGMSKRLHQLLQSETFDVIQIEGVHLAGYWDILKSARGRPRIISDWHNIESELMTRFALNAKNPAIKFYAEATARKLRALEAMLLAEGDSVLVVSARERQALLARAPGASVHVIENGVDTAHYANLGSPTALEKPNVIFVGSMDYHANIDAAIWFATELWPTIRSDHPTLEFKIVGRAPPKTVQALATLPGVIVTGGVPDVRPFYRDALAAVVPLRVGGGTRLKILEGMAAGVPIVSTTLGAEGLEAVPDREILIADTAAAFRASLGRLIEDAALRTRLAHAAEARVASTYDWSAVGTRLFAIHQATLHGAQAA
jgi:polysaccharide biosynthesis protein PslH